MFKLSVSDVVEVPVSIEVQDAGRKVQHKFVLLCRRESQEVLADHTERETKASDVMLGVVTGWRDQRLLLDQDGKPAEFSEDALRAMFSLLPGSSMVAYGAYLQNVGAREKN